MKAKVGLPAYFYTADPGVFLQGDEKGKKRIAAQDMSDFMTELEQMKAEQGQLINHVTNKFSQIEQSVSRARGCVSTA